MQLFGHYEGRVLTPFTNTLLIDQSVDIIKTFIIVLCGSIV